MINKNAFITSTMFSRSNGPANFAMNLYSDQTTNSCLHFFTPDAIKSDQQLTKVNLKFASTFKVLAMILAALDFYIVLRKNNFTTVVWNSSIFPWLSIFMLKKQKHIVFVNDSLSIDAKFEFNYRAIRLLIFKQIEKYNIKNSYKVISNSEIIKEKIVKKYNINPNKINTLFKGINLNDFNTLKSNFEIDTNKNITVTFVKSDPVVGGLMLLCKSLALLEYKFNLNVIGPSCLNDQYKNFTNIHINLLGKLKKEDVCKYMVGSDFFMVPCLKEAFGQANIEALYLQTPTLILPTEYQKKIHKSSYCYFTTGYTSEKISESINYLIKQPSSKREKKAKLAHQTVLKNYSFDATKLKFIEIIND
ncbi:glycosyltransferase [Polaribacter sp. Hel_I_88]|uniref:glycosyltransferase n=1 Tax=Polaribacter sp. Hel_I_88 TaxID=1250006 RepID=UPI000479AB85|nr:glycosyltransferase [Polaribacter sp. Hel_I_88]